MEEFNTIAWNDLMLDENLDLAIQDGDFIIDYAQNQAAKILSIAPAGSFKQHPITGIGITNYLNAPASPTTRTTLITNIKKALEKDGHKNVNISLQGNNIIIQAP